MQIAHLSGDSSDSLGGIARDLRILKEGFASRGHRVECFSPRAKLGELKVGTVALRNLRKFDIVHVHGPTPFISDIVRLNPSVRKLVLTYHSDNEWLSHSISQAYLGIHKVLYARTSGIILQTNSYRVRYGKFRGRVAIIPPPGSVWKAEPELLAMKNDQFTVIFVGQLRPYKGVPILLAAARALPTIRFVICGGGRLQDRFTRFASRVGNVEFRGPLSESDLRREYVRSHVVLLPSANNSEAYGITLLEGATLGAFPVASRLPGVSEHIELLGGDTFPVGSVNGLVTILRNLSDHRDLWAERASLSMQRAARYNATHDNEWYCNAHEAFYKQVIGA